MFENIEHQFNKALFVVNSSGDFPQKSFDMAMSFTSSQNILLDVICILPDFGPLNLSHSSEILLQIEESSLKSIKNQLTSSIKSHYPDYSGEVIIKFGKEFVEVLRCVVNQNYDLLIKQAESKHWLQTVFGSDDLHFLRKCPSAVWLIEKDAPNTYQNIGLSLDFSDDDLERELNERLAFNAQQFAVTFDSDLHLITAFDSGLASFAGSWAENSEEFELSYLREESSRRKFEAKYLIESLQNKDAQDTQKDIDASRYHSHVIQGHPQQVIPNLVLQNKIDLLVMGTVARSGIMGILIGNTAEAILLQVKCSLFSIKPKGFECPISV